MISTHILVGGVLPGALSDSLTVGAGKILVLFKRPNEGKEVVGVRCCSGS